MPHPEDKIYLNALNVLFANNFSTLFSLLSTEKSAKQIWDSLSSPQRRNIDPLIEWRRLKENKIDFILKADKEYPKLLKEISYAPFGLYVKGKVPNEMPAIAVVGTRKVSSYGKLVTEKLVQELVQYNFTIISGLAYGVDSIAHQTVLENRGQTIAVLGSGINNIFPSINKKLAQEITKDGALISEYSSQAPALKQYFPWRNRIISGLCLATIVIEAPEKSGALITARFALDQDREVFAIPGSIFSKNSIGPHNLIKQGAKLVSQVEDILEELNIQYSLPIIKDVPDLKFDSKEEEKIYQLLSKANPLPIDKIIESSNLSPKEVLAILSFLELKGFIKNIDGSNYVKQI
jgi:DNA processing protein